MFHCEYNLCEFKIRNERVMKVHVVREHGVTHATKYRLSASSDFFGTSHAAKRGQTTCSHCGLVHNNRARPNQCNCGQSLAKITTPTQLNAFKLMDQKFSVRKNVAGLNKRVIVDVENNICYSEVLFKS